MSLAPILLFVYKRPLHTQQTLEALAANKLANDSTLYIYADGPSANASKDVLEKIAETRKVIRKKKWCKEVVIIEGNYNKGLADSIISAVTQVVNEHKKVIVLEDDLITSPGFLVYMNDALELYKEEHSVMHVSGYMFPVKKKLPSTFFYNTCSCWGWGTWKRAWDKLQTDAKSLHEQLLQKNLMYKFNIEGTADFEKQLIYNIENKISTWAVKWYASLILNGGFSLHPYPSLVNNIGHDNSGENCVVSNKFYWPKLANSIKVRKIEINESKMARSAMREFNTGKLNFYDRTKNLLPPIMKRSAKRLINLIRKSSPKIDPIRIELERIHKIPRYTEFETNILGNQIKCLDSASFFFMYKEIFEKEIYDFKCDSDKPFIIDCGANIGLSIIYFKRKYSEAEILAFEPDTKVYKCLTHNVKWLDDVKLFNKALWDDETTLKFYSEGADSGRIEKIPENALVIETQTKRLKSFLNRTVDFLKIDIEGAELRVLKDCEDELKNVKILFIEYHSFVGEKQKLSCLIGILEKSGFRYHITSIGVSSQRPFIYLDTYNSMDMQLNIYAFRQ